MYADDNRLYISLVSQSKCSNLLSLNQSKTKFLLVGLPAQLPKISDPSVGSDSHVALIAVYSSARVDC